MFIDEATLRFHPEKGFGQTYWILCPVCWNSGIKITLWDSGAEDSDECINCERFMSEDDARDH